MNFPILGITFQITPDGNVETADLTADAPPEVTIGIAPDVIMRMALGDKTALSSASVEGDGVLANDVSAALDAFDWVLALRPYLGDIAATRAAQFMVGFGQWRDKAHEAMGRSIAEYSTYEASLLANSNALQHFSQEVDTLRDDTARLEARLALLERSR